MKTLGIAAALVGLSLAVFWPVLEHDFLEYDDDVYVLDNPNLRGGLAPSALAWAFRPYEANWIPATWISLQLDWTLWGPSARAFHGTNLALHTATGLLLFLLLLRVTRERPASAVVAAVFLLHPLHVESVAWIAERKDTLSGFGFVLALAAHAHYAARPSARRYAAVVAAGVLALLAKPMLVTLPAVLLLFDVWPLRRRERGVAWTRLVLEKGPLIALAGFVALATLDAQAAYGALADEGALSLRVRILNALASLGHYLMDAVWPRDLAVFYPHPRDAVSIAMATAGGLALLAGSAAAFHLRKRAPAYAIGWCWFIGMLVPVLGLLQVGEQARADRYTYLPLIGLTLALAFPVAQLARARGAGRALAAFAAVAVLALASAARLQVGHWKDTETLFRHAADVTTGNYLAHQWVGSTLLHRSELDAAGEAFERARVARPGWAPPLQGLADVAAERGHWRAALADYERALQAAPDDARVNLRLARALVATGRSSEALERARHAVAVGQGSDQLDALSVLGAILTEVGRVDEALAAYDRAIEGRPDHPGLHGARGLALLRALRAAEAQASFERALELGARDPQLYVTLGDTLLLQGQRAKALRHYETALSAAPEDPKVLQHTATILATGGPGVADPPRALRLAREALQRTGPTAESHAAIAEAHGALGDLARAIAHNRKGEAIAQQTGRTDLAARIRSRRAGWEQRSTSPQTSP